MKAVRGVSEHPRAPSRPGGSGAGSQACCGTPGLGQCPGCRAPPAGMMKASTSKRWRGVWAPPKFRVWRVRGKGRRCVRAVLGWAVCARLMGSVAGGRRAAQAEVQTSSPRVESAWG